MSSAAPRYHLSMAEDKQLTKHFKASEFWCKHCKEQGIKPEFVDLLQEFRDFIGVPLVITSGYRCKNHPVEASKKPGSIGRHTLGVAVDLFAPSITMEQLYSKIEEFGRFQGVGVSVARKFIHCDTRQGKARWCYSSTGKTLPWNGEWKTPA